MATWAGGCSVLTAHVRRSHQHYHSSGHVWQGRFKAFPVQEDEHLLSVLRYVERNPLRAGLVSRAVNWPWSSLRWWGAANRPDFLEEGPVAHPRAWVPWVEAALTAAELAPLRRSVQRGSPYGTDAWARGTAKDFGLEASLRPRGRPPKRAHNDAEHK
jgi:putative transposase